MNLWRSLILWAALVTLVACGPAAPTLAPSPASPTTGPATETPATADAATADAATASAPPTATASPTGAPEALASTARLAPTAPLASAAAPQVEVVAAGLAVPWALAFAPDGRILLTERAGRLRVIEQGALRPEPLATLPVAAIGEGGLMGLALDPAYPANGWLYLMYTYSQDGQVFNRIARFTLADDALQDEVVLIDGIPGARFHNGGRLAFGPDGMLYAGTGDAGAPQLAQRLDSLAGKILRLRPDGSVPADSPFAGSYVYSLGHRNPQGLAWHPDTGVLYASEHGPSGEFGLCCRDEVNRIVPGGNYGWPYVAGEDVVDAARAGSLALIGPVASSGADTWAPAGLAFYAGGPLAAWQGDLFVGALRGRHLRRLTLEGALQDRASAQEALYLGEYGRIREVIMGPDGYLYLATSNRDGRGQPAADDDRILRIGARQ